ncbi:MAG: D-aminopeptidase [Pikeienuella sp.]
MTGIDMKALEAAAEAIPTRFSGPGGVLGVAVEGRAVLGRAWGFADLDSRQPMTAKTRLPLCSISKQFTCAALLAACGAPEALDDRLRAHLPRFEGKLPTVRDLCNNQSGLRDYWALTVLHGARAEQHFRREDAAPVFARMKTGHFEPGARYSYSNGNFRLLAEMIETETGEPIEALYARHIWAPAGMTGAALTADTRSPVDGVTGYEGVDATGYLPARNGVHWFGDAGISASLKDMLAYECWIDAGRDDPAHLYRRIAAPQDFRDGNPAAYGFGLAHFSIAGARFTGHGGALRGFRAFRLYSPDVRLSVVAMFNHQADAQGATLALVRAALGQGAPAPRPVAGSWSGQWISRETGLLARLSPERSTVALRFGTSPEALTETGDGRLGSASVESGREGDALVMRRPQENYQERLDPAPPVERADGAEIAGRYHAAELEGEMVIEARDGGVYAWFEGFLGSGRPEIMRPAGEDLWIICTRRALDAPAPGDWTLRVERGADGLVSGATLGCWLARGIGYRRVGGGAA